MKITVTVNGGLDDYADGLEEKANELAQQLVFIGKQKALEKLAAAEYAGTKAGVKILASGAREGKAALFAFGSNAMFIEFGTGVTDVVSTLHPLFQLVPPRGSYGKGKGMNPPWYYKGDPGNGGELLKNGFVRTWGNDPGRYMYDASVLMRRVAVKTAKEVFEE